MCIDIISINIKKIVINYSCISSLEYVYFEMLKLQKGKINYITFNKSNSILYDVNYFEIRLTSQKSCIVRNEQNEVTYFININNFNHIIGLMEGLLESIKNNKCSSGHQYLFENETELIIMSFNEYENGVLVK